MDTSADGAEPGSASVYWMRSADPCATAPAPVPPPRVHEQVSYDPRFRLYLQTKLSNPHYKPEVAAQTTLVNFCVTEKGLEDQLLALVVDCERPDLQEQAASLVRSLNQYNITLVELENNLLFNLANATVSTLGIILMGRGEAMQRRLAVDTHTLMAWC